VTNSLDNLPADISRHRILNSAEAARFWGVSVPTWRRMYRAKVVPLPIQLSARKLGWRAGDLIDALAARQAR
jgi:predicted DNA-binding transcriptional regulator AlpA